MASSNLSVFRNWVLRSPPAEWFISQLRSLLIGALRQGPIPQHVAFVMDGNRRYARSHKIETVEGHHLGFEALARILEVCYKAGVRVVTIYAFSIENFKRSKFEVDALMNMAKIKLSQLAQHGELLDRYGASIQILGQKNLLRADVLESIEEAVSLTKHNKHAVLNVCFPYTSRDEITTAIRSTVAEYSTPLPSRLSKRTFSANHITHTLRSRQLSTLKEESRSRSSTPDPVWNESRNRDESGLASSADVDRNTSGSNSPFSSSTTLTQDSTPPSFAEELNPEATEKPVFPDVEQITADVLTDHMFTAGMPPLDLLVRTSGVERLSDFMLWQCHEDTSIVFLKCLWPEFDLWQFLPVLVEWQWWKRKEQDAWTRTGMGETGLKTS